MAVERASFGSSSAMRIGCVSNSDIDIKILFSRVDSPEKKQLWTYNKNKTSQKKRVFKESQLWKTVFLYRYRS